MTATKACSALTTTSISIEAEGWIDKEGNTSRHMQFEARKVAIARPDISPSAADELDEPIVVCRASGTCVTPKDCQRKK